MFKARKTGTVAARNIMGEHFEWDYTDFADFLHSTYEVVWMGCPRRRPGRSTRNVVIIKMPVDGNPARGLRLPAGGRLDVIAMARRSCPGSSRSSSTATSRKLVGAHYVGYGVKNAFQYLEVLRSRASPSTNSARSTSCSSTDLTRADRCAPERRHSGPEPTLP